MQIVLLALGVYTYDTKRAVECSNTIELYRATLKQEQGIAWGGKRTQGVYGCLYVRRWDVNRPLWLAIARV